MVLAHSYRTELDFDFDIINITGSKLLFIDGSLLISFLNISMTISWKISPISASGSSAFMRLSR